MMAYDRAADFLEPIDLAEHLDKIELYLGQVCQIAGISKMQLDYWTNKAQIPTKGKKQRIYDIDALETVMLIKQAKDKGLNLGAAIDAAHHFRAAQNPPASQTPQKPHAPPAPANTRRLPRHVYFHWISSRRPVAAAVAHVDGGGEASKPRSGASL